jgi:hypothetical protein
VGSVHHLVSGEVHLDQAGSRDLVEQHAVGIDQEVVLRPGHPRGDVGEHEVVPAVMRHETVAGGEIDALRPFGLAHAGSDRRIGRFVGAHGRSLTLHFVTASRRACSQPANLPSRKTAVSRRCGPQAARTWLCAEVR